MTWIIWPKRFVIAILFEKLLLYGSFRMLYAWSALLVDDWGISREEMGFVLAAGEFSAIPAGFLTTFGDVYGNKRIGLLAWLASLLSSFGLLAPPILGGLIFCRVVFSFAATVYFVCSQSTLIGLVHSNDHGWATGIAEAGWSLSILILVPLLSLLYQYFGWRVAFLAIALLFIPGLLEVIYYYPKDEKHTFSTKTIDIEEENSQWDEVNVQETGDMTNEAATEKHTPSRLLYSKTFLMPGPIFFNLSSLLINVAHNLLFLSFAIWAHEYHGLDAESMGAASFAIGGAELMGDILVITIGDKIGLYRSIYLFLILFGLFTLIFAFFAHISFAMGLAFVCIANIPGEYLIVAQIAVVEKFVPKKFRTTVLGINFQAHFTGRAIGALISEYLWQWNELFGLGVVAIIVTILAILCVFIAARYLPQEEDDDNDNSSNNEFQNQNESSNNENQNQNDIHDESCIELN